MAATAALLISAYCAPCLVRVQVIGDVTWFKQTAEVRGCNVIIEFVSLLDKKGSRDVVQAHFILSIEVCSTSGNTGKHTV